MIGALFGRSGGADSRQWEFVPELRGHCIRDLKECSALSWLTRCAASSDLFLFLFFFAPSLNCVLMPAKHRNVFFRDDGPDVPFSAFDSIYPKDLWIYQEIQRNLGHENLAIPHNGNISDGWMYSLNEFLGGPMDAEYAKRRARNEPLTEIIQTKGQSDTHPVLSPNDEFGDFELFQNLLNVGQPRACTGVAETPVPAASSLTVTGSPTRSSTIS
jgi:hypothetical protein